MDKSQLPTHLVHQVGKDVMKQRVINPTLEREVIGHLKMTLCCAVLMLLDVSKQLCSYGMKYYNRGVYPLPQTQLVASAELIKFIVFLFVTAVSHGGLRQIRLSVWYAVPSITYIANSNIFYLALHYTTPPVWSILMQMRIILTALTYRFFFHRKVTDVQWIALTILMSAIIVCNWSASQATIGGQHPGHFLKAALLALLASVISVVGTVVMEFLFKNDDRSFCDMQTQLYMFTSIGSWSAYTVDTYANGNSLANLKGPFSIVCTLMASDVMLTCIIGFLIAVVVKKFDNIVKLYTQAIANMFMAVGCSLLFPEFFRFHPVFIGCIAVVFAAIVLYESKDFDVSDSPIVRRCAEQCSLKLMMTSFIVLLIVSIGGAAVFYNYLKLSGYVATILEAI